MGCSSGGQVRFSGLNAALIVGPVGTFSRSGSDLLIRRESALSVDAVSDAIRNANVRALSAPGTVIRTPSPEMPSHIRRATADSERLLRPSNSGWLRRRPRSGPSTPVDERPPLSSSSTYIDERPLPSPPAAARDSYASTAPSFAFTAGSSATSTAATAAREADAALLPILYNAVAIERTPTMILTPDVRPLPMSGAQMLDAEAGTALEVLWEEGTQPDGRPVWLFCRIEGGPGGSPKAAGYMRHDRVVALR